jgi:HAD superfamily hydrolase (TIGR01509 family)
MNILIPLCGIGKRFTEAGYDKPKPLISIFNKTMIQHVLDSLRYSLDDKIFIIYHISLDSYNFSNFINEYYPNIYLIPITFRTSGAAETVRFGIDYILNNNLSILKDILIIDCDTIYNVNIIKKLKRCDNNAVIYFEDKGCNPIYSYIQLKNDIICDIIEKEKISNHANTGAYYFNDIVRLKESCIYIIENNIKFKNEYYMSCVIKYMLNKGDIFKGIKINRAHYISLGTPNELTIFKKNHYSFLFDLDGTLVKTDSIYFKVWTEILNNYNIVLTYDIFKKYICGNTDITAMEQLQIDNTSYDINKISELKDNLFLTYINDLIVMEGAYNFIKNIKKLGHFVSIVTNCNRKTCELILNHMGIIKYIDYIIIGNECNRSKPYPDPYLKAIELSGSDKNKCIIFEDSKPGLLSALSVSPKNIIGVNNGSNSEILKMLNIKTVIDNYNNIDISNIVDNKNNLLDDINKLISQSLSKKYDISTINIQQNKLKGGYISDVIKVDIKLQSGKELQCVLKYENDYTSSLTKMAYKLGLFDREYYFYENISNFVNINIPKYIGTIKDDNFITKGILLENLNRDDFVLNLDLNKENIDVSLKVIDECAKFHSLFWNKDLSKSFSDVKKHNNDMFNPVWSDFIHERWPIFITKWKHILKDSTIEKLQNIVDNFNNIQEYLSKDNLTLCHGDVKSGNIFYRKIYNNGYIPYFIDWQYIANGKGIQDIVFFIIESFDIEHIKEYTDLFKKYYYIKLKEYGINNYSWDDYIKDFNYSIYYFPFFVAIWFGTTHTDDLIDVSFPFIFIQKFLYFIEYYTIDHNT